MKSIRDKLGMKPGWRAGMLSAPEYLREIIGLPDILPDGTCDLLLAFVTDAAAVGAAWASLGPIYKRGGGLWFAYPKKSGAIRSSLSRDAGWDALTAAGLIPVTQIALDDDWSALRFRYRDEVKKITRKEG